MRFAGLSLVGLLVVIGIIALIQRVYTVPMVQRGQSARQQVQQLAGQDQSGMRHSESITFSPAGSGRRFEGLLVDTVVVGGPMNARFGLLPGDVITGIAELPDLGFIAGNDPETAAALILEAYQRQQSLVVDRPDIGRIQLPRDANQVSPQQQAALTPVAPAANGQPTTATPPAAQQGTAPLERKETFLDRLQRKDDDAAQ